MCGQWVKSLPYTPWWKGQCIRGLIVRIDLHITLSSDPLVFHSRCQGPLLGQQKYIFRLTFLKPLVVSTVAIQVYWSATDKAFRYYYAIITCSPKQYVWIITLILIACTCGRRMLWATKHVPLPTSVLFCGLSLYATFWYFHMLILIFMINKQLATNVYMPQFKWL